MTSFTHWAVPVNIKGPTSNRTTSVAANDNSHNNNNNNDTVVANNTIVTKDVDASVNPTTIASGIGSGMATPKIIKQRRPSTSSSTTLHTNNNVDGPSTLAGRDSSVATDGTTSRANVIIPPLSSSGIAAALRSQQRQQERMSISERHQSLTSNSNGNGKGSISKNNIQNITSDLANIASLARVTDITHNNEYGGEHLSTSGSHQSANGDAPNKSSSINVTAATSDAITAIPISPIAALSAKKVHSSTRGDDQLSIRSTRSHKDMALATSNMNHSNNGAVVVGGITDAGEPTSPIVPVYVPVSLPLRLKSRGNSIVSTASYPADWIPEATSSNRNVHAPIATSTTVAASATSPNRVPSMSHRIGHHRGASQSQFSHHSHRSQHSIGDTLNNRQHSIGSARVVATGVAGVVTPAATANSVSRLPSLHHKPSHHHLASISSSLAVIEASSPKLSSSGSLTNINIINNSSSIMPAATAIPSADIVETTDTAPFPLLQVRGSSDLLTPLPSATATVGEALRPTSSSHSQHEMPPVSDDPTIARSHESHNNTNSNVDNVGIAASDIRVGHVSHASISTLIEPSRSMSAININNDNASPLPQSTTTPTTTSATADSSRSVVSKAGRQHSMSTKVSDDRPHSRATSIEASILTDTPTGNINTNDTHTTNNNDHNIISPVISSRRNTPTNHVIITPRERKLSSSSRSNGNAGIGTAAATATAIATGSEAIATTTTPTTTQGSGRTEEENAGRNTIASPRPSTSSSKSVVHQIIPSTTTLANSDTMSGSNANNDTPTVAQVSACKISEEVGDSHDDNDGINPPITDHDVAASSTIIDDHNSLVEEYTDRNAKDVAPIPSSLAPAAVPTTLPINSNNLSTSPLLGGESIFSVGNVNGNGSGNGIVHDNDKGNSNSDGNLLDNKKNDNEITILQSSMVASMLPSTHAIDDLASPRIIATGTTAPPSAVGGGGGPQINNINDGDSVWGSAPTSARPPSPPNNNTNNSSGSNTAATSQLNSPQPLPRPLITTHPTTHDNQHHHSHHRSHSKHLASPIPSMSGQSLPLVTRFPSTSPAASIVQTASDVQPLSSPAMSSSLSRVPSSAIKMNTNGESRTVSRQSSRATNTNTDTSTNDVPHLYDNESGTAPQISSSLATVHHEREPSADSLSSAVTHLATIATNDETINGNNDASTAAADVVSEPQQRHGDSDFVQQQLATDSSLEVAPPSTHAMVASDNVNDNNGDNISTTVEPSALPFHSDSDPFPSSPSSARHVTQLAPKTGAASVVARPPIISHSSSTSSHARVASPVDVGMTSTPTPPAPDLLPTRNTDPTHSHDIHNDNDNTSNNTLAHALPDDDIKKDVIMSNDNANLVTNNNDSIPSSTSSPKNGLHLAQPPSSAPVPD
jgi:hypothetical protein